MFTSLIFGRVLTNKFLYTIRNGYKSSISLDKLYPKTNLDILAKPDVKFLSNSNNDEAFSGYIPMDKVEIRKTGSSKPGGQHVNKSISFLSQSIPELYFLFLFFFN